MVTCYKPKPHVCYAVHLLLKIIKPAWVATGGTRGHRRFDPAPSPALFHIHLLQCVSVYACMFVCVCM